MPQSEVAHSQTLVSDGPTFTAWLMTLGNWLNTLSLSLLICTPGRARPISHRAVTRFKDTKKLTGNPMGRRHVRMSAELE